MYIGIDLGTTTVKGYLYDENGTVISRFSREYTIQTKGLYATQNADDWWNLTREAISSVGGGKDIKAISISTQGISFVPVDAKGSPLCPALTWLDMRATEQTETLKRTFGDIYARTGKPCEATYTLPKLMWLKEKEPDIYKNIYKLLLPLDYLNMKLCGNFVTDYTIASGTMAFDINSMKWDNELLNFAGIKVDKLPEVLPMGTDLGNILPGIADELGIPKSTRLILGGQDQKLAAIGAGINYDKCTVSLGTAAAISKLCKNRTDMSSEIPCFALSDSDFIFETCVPTAGAAVKWLCRLFDIDYLQLDVLAGLSQSGANGVIINPDFINGASISDLSLSSDKADIARALLEGTSRAIADKIEKLGGTESIIVFGGGAKSEIWCKILGMIVKAKVIRHDAETASLGAAILASGYKIRPTE